MKTNPEPSISIDQVEQIAQNLYHDPFQILGPHQIKVGRKKVWVIRTWLPDAKQVYLEELDSKKETKMPSVFNEHFFELQLPEWKKLKNYRFRVIAHNGHERYIFDPYFFLPQLDDTDLYLFGAGDHHKIYEKLGAHVRTVDGVEGVYFAVWAPNARNVSVLGDFNQWHGGKHQMRVLGSSGIWELFIPGIGLGETYKYEIKDRNGKFFIKSDPYGFQYEKRPKTASVVADINSYQWNDTVWLEKRRHADTLQEPISIYEVHLGSWKKKYENEDGFLSYRELAHDLVEYVKYMNFTHVELLPVAEHPLDASWGYQVTGYFAPTSRFGTPADFQYFVDHCHKNDIGVILDWVPAHFPKDDHGLAYFDGSHLYEHSDPRLGEHMDWGTLIFNYGRNEVRNFLIANALFWFDKYHIDGLRVDAVASMLYLDYSREQGEWLPNKFGGRENLEAIDFIKRLNELIFSYFPGALMVAEESTAWPGVSKPTYANGLGFNLKWNMGWMHDFLTYFSKDPVHRKFHHNMITFALLYAFHENFTLVLSHDEVVHGKRAMLDKMPGDIWQKFANLRTLYAFMYGHPGKKLLFMGSEFGQWDEWDEAKSIDWHLVEYDSHKNLQLLVSDLNKLYKQEPALYENDVHSKGFQWIDFQDSENSIISFIRKSNDPQDILIFVCNFTPVYRENYRVGVPYKAFYKEILNTDAEIYGGSNKGNSGGLVSENKEWHYLPHSINIIVPPLATVVFRPVFEPDNLQEKVTN